MTRVRLIFSDFVPCFGEEMGERLKVETEKSLEQKILIYDWKKIVLNDFTLLNIKGNLISFTEIIYATSSKLQTFF